jgi:hypothetical protein
MRLVAPFFVLILFCAVIGWNNAAYAQPQTNPYCEYGTNAVNKDTDRIKVVPTFHSLSLYWRPAGVAPDKAAYAMFRERGSTDGYRRSLDLVFAPDDGEYRGSLIQLRSGTAYDIVLTLEGGNSKTISAETWCETLPVAATVYIPTDVAQDAPFEIKNIFGSPDGYILYTAHPDESGVLDAGGVVRHNIVIENASYIIIRGLSLRNAEREAIYFKFRGQTHDIVIENNVIEKWGRIDEVSGFAEPDHAIRTLDGVDTNFARLIIQRNAIRKPRGDTNSWLELREDKPGCASNTMCQPVGPYAVYLRNTAGNHVIRYNEISSSSGNYFQDGIGGGNNNSTTGAINRDSDIYGNVIRNVWDDAIESGGGNQNVRIWGNLIDKAFVAFGLAPIAKGPVYVFRNVVHRTQLGPGESGRSGVFIKNKSTAKIGGGEAFVFHNTIFRKGSAGGVQTGVTSDGTSLVSFTTRNNIIDSRGQAFENSNINTSPMNDLDHDLYQGSLENLPDQERNGIVGKAVYEDAQVTATSAQAVQADTSPGLDTGVPIPNFNDDAVNAPDIGAQEKDAPTLEFGVNAYLGGTEQPSPPPRSCI